MSNESTEERPLPSKGPGGWKPSKRPKVFLYILLGIIVYYLAVYIPMPFFTYKPGTAEELKPMVHVKEGYPDEKGTFMLTTVRMGYTNFLSYLQAQFDPNVELVKKNEVLRKGETQQEYSERQQFVMQSSQSNSVQAAYNKAQVRYRINDKGIVVLQTEKDLPASKVLKAGDKLLKIGETPIKSNDDLISYLEGKKIGDRVELTYSRAGKRKTVSVKLGALSETGNARPSKPNRPVIGIVAAQLLKVEAEDPDKQVEIKAEDIGGPSAGLMFTLEIYNQLVREDITKGYRIAGTGTIDPEGNVGVIGGIQHKIVAADREGAEIFFAPKDYYPKDKRYKPIKNTSDAIAKAKKIETKMKIVSVSTMDDALRYLEKLPPKSKS